MGKGRGLCIPPSQVRESTKRNIIETQDTLVESGCCVVLSCITMECSKVRNPFGEPELCTCDCGGMMSMEIANGED